METKSGLSPDARDRLKALVDTHGGATVVAAGSGVPKSTLDKYLGGHSEPPAVRLASIAQFCHSSTEWIIYGKATASHLEAGSGARAVTLPDMDAVAMIPRLSVRASAGIGVNNHDHPDAVRVPISRALLRRLGIRPEAAHVIEASGDSMEPTIRDADEILVHAGSLAGSEVRSEGIYVVILDDVTMIKRLQPILGALQLISDNERYAPIVIPRDELERLRVIGQVRMVMRVV